MDIRQSIKEKNRVVIKIGSSSLTHKNTGNLDLAKLEVLIREISNIKNMGKEVIVVSSGAIAVGSRAVGMKEKPTLVAEKQACAAIGQAQLMMIYQKLFAEYGQMAAQVLMTKSTITNPTSRNNAFNTFEELLKLGAIPIVNENDTVSTYEIQFGDNDTLSALVSSLVRADLLILLSDIDGLFTDDPHTNPDSKFIEQVDKITEELMGMGKSSSTSKVGTGGMSTKLTAAKIATTSGADMIIANGEDFHIIHRILEGEKIGTLFVGRKDHSFSLLDYLNEMEL